MITNPLTLTTMNSSPSISNYAGLGLYSTKADPTLKFAGDGNGRAIRKRFKKPTPVQIQYEFTVSVSILNLINGNKKEIETVTVSGGGNQKKFISMEAAQNWANSNR